MLKFLLFFSTIFILSCQSSSEKENPVPHTGAVDTIKDNAHLLMEREQAASDKDADYPGELVRRVAFDVKTTDFKNYPDGIIYWASIENPKRDIPGLIDGNKVIVPENNLTVIINYPLLHECRFELTSKGGFTRAGLLQDISNYYYKIYEEEEKTATIKTIPQNKRKNAYNRNETNGKYGIWDHDLSDLVLAEILVCKTPDGKILLSLIMES